MIANHTRLAEFEKCVFDRTSPPPEQFQSAKWLATAVLEQAVDEWRQRGTFGKDEQTAEYQQEDNNRRQPPLLIEAQEVPKLFDNRELVHVACG